jgi:demethylmenaquinone methyltransferase/2-methoxy-6-polyprenyl-1,4-benzoquinol methylase
MFDSVARRYDVVNALLSFGLDRRWRRAAARSMAIRPGDIVLDLGCGTGELGRLFAGRCRVVGLDLSLEMLKVARQRIRTGPFVQASAFRLPFRAAGFSAAVSAFLLRNLNDLQAAFGELARVLAPEGRVALLDITEPQSAPLRQLFDAYFSRAAPTLGALAGNAHAYRYLAGSLVQLPPAKEVLDLLGDAGFDRAAARPMTGGVVTLFTAVRR